MANKLSDHGDLTTLAKEIEELIKKRIGSKGPLSIGVAYTSPPDYRTVHWVTNLDRVTGIRLFTQTINAMRSQAN